MHTAKELDKYKKMYNITAKNYRVMHTQVACTSHKSVCTSHCSVHESSVDDVS